MLEYRGYDSVGVGVIVDGAIAVRRRAGRIADLEKVLADGALAGCRIGIGHSRWATHGAPTDANAHPHSDASGRVLVVHNGIIENDKDLRAELEAAGTTFTSETDTEVLAHLVAAHLAEAGGDLAKALRRALAKVRGYYAIAVLHQDASGEAQLVCAREGPPLCVGAGTDGTYLASDSLAILPHTRDVLFLEDGEIAVLTPDSIRLTNREGEEVEREAQHIDWDAEDADRGGFEHFMLKEIHEQPEVIARCVQGRADLEAGDVRLDGEFFGDERLRSVERLEVLACGTALHAGLVLKYLVEGLAGIPVDVDFASEYRYRRVPSARATVAIGISQSGETADTLAALRKARDQGCDLIAICNAQGSTMVREADASILIQAGPEIGVASTKAFVGMIVAAYLFALRLGRARGSLSGEAVRERLGELQRLRGAVEALLAKERVEGLRDLADRLADQKGFLFLGRGINYPIALEGALKLKEISYLHAEGYPAGEMKHGPIAMIEPDLGAVVLAPMDGVVDKVRSNIEQVKARGGPVVCVGTDPACLELADDAVEVPEIGEWLSPILNVVPLQLFSYYVALRRGCDIDKPRNLAKSVTVE